MFTGISFIIHDIGLYETNKDSIIKLIKKQNREGTYINDASIIDFRNELYLIIDGYSTLCEPEGEFSKELASLLCPAYIEDTKNTQKLYSSKMLLINLEKLAALNEGVLDEEEMTLKSKLLNTFNKTPFTRELIYCGQEYFGSHPLKNIQFCLDNNDAYCSSLSEDIFKATSEKLSVGEIVFIETIYSNEK